MMPLQRAWMLRSGKKQVVKWTAEGAVKCEIIARQFIRKVIVHRVFCNVRAYVSCRGYEGIPLSAQGHSCEFKVAPRILYFCMIRP